MKRVLTNAQMRAADKYTIEALGVSSETLMARAGAAIAEEVEKVAVKIGGKDIIVVCGTGNNGGDGYVTASLLFASGYNVSVYAAEGELSTDCRREKERYKGRYSAHITGAIVVDCLFGTGLCREVTGAFAEIIDKINGSGAYVISADIPSGLNGDNGLVMGGCVKADKTVAIGELKAGLLLNDGLDFCGEIAVKDIGISCPQTEYTVIYGDEDISRLFPARRRNSHKGTYGTANAVAGSDEYIGAAALAVNAMLQSGCGYAKLTSSERVKLSLAPVLPQAVYCGECDLSADAVAIGMGLGVSEEVYKQICYLLKNYNGTLIIDADGLNSLAKYGDEVLKNAKCSVVLTPHVKEFSRLTRLSVEEILLAPLTSAQAYAKAMGVTVLLKGAATVISDGACTAINTRGSTALAKAGSGDILSGFMCGTAARGLGAFDAAVASSYALGLSAEISSREKTDYCANAKDILKNLHSAIKLLTVR